MNGERDVFIAHAHQDKQEFVRPLAGALGRRGVSCWVDEASIGPGDSLIDAINEGLRGAQYIVVPITRRFLDAPWAPRELNAALHLEARQRRTIVIPVLAVDQQRIEDYPLLLDKRWLEWSEGLDHVADEITALFKRRSATDWYVDFPARHQGPVWMRLVPDANSEERRNLTLRWGPFLRRVEVDVGGEPISFVFHKINQDGITLQAQVEPSSLLTFGYGEPPDPSPINIDEGWERAAGWSFASESEAQGEPTVVRAGGAEVDGRTSSGNEDVYYHVRLARFSVITAEVFNLSSRELDQQFVEPWRRGEAIFLKGRRWDPTKAHITIYAGARLTTQQRGFGMGWNKAIEFGENVTDRMFARG